MNGSSKAAYYYKINRRVGRGHNARKHMLQCEINSDNSKKWVYIATIL